MAAAALSKITPKRLDTIGWSGLFALAYIFALSQ
jgi:hypothetical protein